MSNFRDFTTLRYNAIHEHNVRVENMIVDSMKAIGYGYDETMVLAGQGEILLRTYTDNMFNCDLLFKGKVIGKVRGTVKSVCPGCGGTDYSSFDAGKPGTDAFYCNDCSGTWGSQNPDIHYRKT